MSHTSLGPADTPEPMRVAGSPTNTSPADATADEIEADIAATRERLAESVDALADKVNVKAHAERKVDETKAQAKAKVGEATAKATAGEAKGRAQQLVGQAKRASLPVQVAVVALPMTVIVLLILRAVRGRRS